MFCGHCGATNPDDGQYCTKCGQLIGTTGVIAPPPSLTPDPQPRTSGKAIASLILGFFSLLLPAAVGAIILGHISRSEIRRSAGRLKGSGMALAGLILGYVWISAIPVLIIAAIAIPNLLRARMAANEASAIGSLRTIVVAETTYAQKFPDKGYACALTNLGGTGNSAQGAGLIDETLAAGQKYGYRFVVSCAESDPTSYYVGAYPMKQNSTGVRTFCADQAGVVRELQGGTVEDCLSIGEPL